MPKNAHAFECRKRFREGNPALVRHVNVVRILGIKSKAVVRKQHIVTVALHHFFGKMAFITHYGIEVHAVLEQPKRHVVAMFRINYVVARCNALPQIREQFAEKIRIGVNYSNFHIGATPQKLPDDGHTTCRVPKSPIKRSYKNFQFSASSQA